MSSFLFGCAQQQHDHIVWRAIHVSGETQSGEAHLLTMPNGDHVLIDTGFNHYADQHLLPAISSAGVKTIKLALITHAHRNHYGALESVQHKFPIQSLLLNSPPEPACSRETWLMACDSEHLNFTLNNVNQRTTVLSVEPNSLVYSNSGVTIRIMSAKQNLANASVNEASDLFLLEYGSSRVLFSGDIASKAEPYIIEALEKFTPISAMTAPHHGVTETVSASFYRHLEPGLVTVGVSAQVWASARASVTRDYLSAAGIPVYVSGEVGDSKFKITRSKVSEF